MSQTEICDLSLVEVSATKIILPSVNFVTSVQVETDICRVLYAVSIPEYLEAWLEVPGIDRIEFHPLNRSFDKFQIDLYSFDRFQGTSYASCLLSKPNRVTFRWRTDSAGNGAESIVEIRLWKHLTMCIVNLSHSGLCGSEGREWHFRMWQCSLERLRRLVEGGLAKHLLSSVPIVR
jgi:hypothetical protein